MKKKYVFIGDTHPEMISVAREAAILGLKYRLFLPFFLTYYEARVAKYLFRHQKKIIKLVNQRTLPLEISRISLRRPFMILYLASYISRLINSESSSKNFMKVYYYAQKWYLVIYLRIFRPNQTVIYDTYLFGSFIKANLVIICPHVHPTEVERQTAICLRKFPNWLPRTTNVINHHNYEKFIANSRLVVLSEYSKDSFLREGFQGGSISVIPIGPLNIKKNDLDTNQAGSISVVYVGRINPLKGLQTFIAVAKELSPLFSFKIVGSGDLIDIEYLRRLTMDIEIELVLNPETNEAIYEAYSNGDIFLLPSYCEGFSIATLEAMSFGLIPIVTRNSAFPEILKNTKLENFLIEPGDINSVVTILREIHSTNPQQLNNLKQEAIRVAEKYSMEKFGEKFWQELKVDTMNKRN